MFFEPHKAARDVGILKGLTLVSLVLLGISSTGCSSSGSDTPALQNPPAAYAPPAPGLRADNTLSVSGTTRYFDYYVPPALPEDAPVLILLHGGTQNKNRVIDGTTGSTGWLSVAESEAILLIVPNGTGADGDPNAVSAHWNDCRSDQVSGSSADDVAFIAALIDWAVNEPSFVIDENRVYVAGASNGGTVALGSGGQVASSIETRDFWRVRNSTTQPLPPVVYPDIDPTDNSTVVGAGYVGGTGGAAVSWLTVFAGGHTMPSLLFFSTGAQNRDIESAAVAWAFLQDKRR